MLLLIRSLLSNLPSSYPLNRLSPTLFSFATGQAVVYEINFVPFENITIVVNDDFVEIENFQLVLYNVSSVVASIDTKVGATVGNAIDAFFREDHTRTLSYVCDFGDDRQWARKRKFDQWYNLFAERVNIKKVDGTVIADNTEYLISLLTSNSHPYQATIEAEFFKGADSLNK